MLKQMLSVCLLLAAAASSGCCCFTQGSCATCPNGSYAGGPIAGAMCSLANCTKKTLGCCSGCGDVYVDEWVSDPPQPCDPCDNCGTWVGGGDCGNYGPLGFGILPAFKSLFGHPYVSGCDCGHCGGEEGVVWDDQPYEVIEGEHQHG